MGEVGDGSGGQGVCDGVGFENGMGLWGVR